MVPPLKAEVPLAVEVMALVLEAMLIPALLALRTAASFITRMVMVSPTRLGVGAITSFSCINVSNFSR